MSWVFLASLAALAAPEPAASSAAQGPVGPAADSAVLDQARAMSDAFAAVAESVADATVYIEADKGPSVAPGLAELMRDYDLPAPAGRGGGVVSSGSGVVISADGLVLTNHHVIAGCDAPVVTLRDRRQYPAEVVGSDARTDIAVLRIEGDGPFAWAELGDSDGLALGQWVIAVGHPFDFQFTVTTGVISARGRRNLFDNEIQDYLQTDAAVNPGSSGGPLFDLWGRVVGINTAIYTPPGGGHQNAGISFAIPSNMAGRIVEEILSSGRVGRATLGLSTRDHPASRDDPRPGAEVTRVLAGGPAEAAGLRRGDIIVAVDGEPIADSADLRALVLARGVRTDLVVEWERGRKTMSATVETGEDGELARVTGDLPADTVSWAGLTLGAVDDDALVQLGVSPPADRPVAIVVYAVAPGSSGAIAGLEPGDLLLSAGDADLDSVDQLLDLAEGRNSVSLRLWRNGGKAWAVVAGLQDAD